MDAGVQEGLRLSRDRLERMAERCREVGAHFVVALIPTKERVHEPWIAGPAELSQYEIWDALLRNEHEVDRQLRQFLRDRGIPYLDLEGPLREAAARAAIYPLDRDGHPNSDGYAVIAHTVAQAIEPWRGEAAAPSAER